MSSMPTATSSQAAPGGAAQSAVLLVAHGSRFPESNTEVGDLAVRLAGRLGPAQVVSHAFLELGEPSIAEAIDALADDGIEHIMVIPYFLAAGRHVAEDIPSIVAGARERHPGLKVETTAHFGAQDQVPEILAAMARGVAGS